MKKPEWLSQLRRGVMEYASLLLISQQSTYGYELITALNKHPILSTAEGTLYPLLKRLEKDGLISTTWRETTPGVPPRKYYDITPDGTAFLEEMKNEWTNLISAIKGLQEKETN